MTYDEQQVEGAKRLPIHYEIMNDGFTKLFIHLPDGRQVPLHLLTQPDHSEPHDHPFDIEINVVAGGYKEEVYRDNGNHSISWEEEGNRFWTNADKIHRITEISEDGYCLTQCEYGPWKQESGVYRWVDGVKQHRLWHETEWKNYD